MPRPRRGTQQPVTTRNERVPRSWTETGIPHACAWLATTVYGLSGDPRDWHPIFARVSAHLAVLIVAIASIGFSQVDWSAEPVPSQLASTTLLVGSNDEKSANLPALLPDRNQRPSPVFAKANSGIFRQAQLYTIIPERPRLTVVTYTVQAGDTVQSIADQFGLEPTTVMWANPAVEDAPDLLRIGQQVLILPIDGVYHIVKEEDTLASIAEEYKVEADAIVSCSYNTLTQENTFLQSGDHLIVPGGEKEYQPRSVTSYTGSIPEGARGTGRFQWPIRGSITQGYWYGHRAIDIGAPTGSAVLATDGGFIGFAGWTDVGYGYLIVIDHANGFATYYAHLSQMYVVAGQEIERGQVIGAVGNTGNSTGPHLHFEVRRDGVQQNPRAYLP